MNSLHKLARIILIGLGIYILSTLAVDLLSIVPYLVSESGEQLHRVLFWSILSALLSGLYGGVIIYLLLRSDLLVQKIVGSEEPQESRGWWVPFAFRLACIFAGLLWLYSFLSVITSETQHLILLWRSGIGITAGQLAWHSFVSSAVQLGIGIYLVCGAPHFVRWQVKKTIEQCKRFEGEKKVSEEDAAP